ncbi:hypothetical protein Taro_024876, partial [Colocasia esculenta]|nr:hypothetical protein [Colocasia esculenta]
RHELGTLIHSSEYLAHVATLREESRDVAHEISCLVSDHRFWHKIIYYLKLIEPLVQVLRMVDGEDKNDMSYLYEAIDKAKERLREKHPMAYQKWWRIIDARWESTLHHDLHVAGAGQGDAGYTGATGLGLTESYVPETEYQGGEGEGQVMDKGDMKDNNIMQPMSGHLGSQTIVQGLLIYLHFSLPFYRTQILVAHLLEYKEDGYLGLHKNKSIVKQQVIQTTWYMVSSSITIWRKLKSTIYTKRDSNGYA